MQTLHESFINYLPSATNALLLHWNKTTSQVYQKRYCTLFMNTIWPALAANHELQRHGSSAA